LSTWFAVEKRLTGDLFCNYVSDSHNTNSPAFPGFGGLATVFLTAALFGFSIYLGTPPRHVIRKGLRDFSVEIMMGHAEPCCSHEASANVAITSERLHFVGIFPYQIWALMALGLLRSRHLASGSALLCASGHFPSLSAL